MLFVLISHLFVLCCVVVSFQVCAAHSDQLDFLGQDHRRGRRPEEDDRQHPIPHQVNGRAKINQYYKKKVLSVNPWSILYLLPRLHAIQGVGEEDFKRLGGGTLNP